MGATQTQTPWRQAAVTAAEGIYALGWLLVRLVESVCLLTAFRTATPAAYATAACATVGSSLLLAPWRLGCWLWHRRLGERVRRIPGFSLLWTGFRRLPAAVGWSFGVWWRQTARWLVCLLPTALLWGYGDYLSLRGDAAYSLFWPALGCVTLLAGSFWAVLGGCRYALVPLLLDRGYTAALAIPLSVRLTRCRRRQWIDFWGARWGRLLLCLVPGVSLWAVGSLRQAYLALLEGWLEPDALPVFSAHTRRLPTP